ncbi:hypothetical protein COOONC_16909 [Cooperia oncophora]
MDVMDLLKMDTKTFFPIAAEQLISFACPQQAVFPSAETSELNGVKKEVHEEPDMVEQKAYSGPSRSDCDVYGHDNGNDEHEMKCETFMDSDGHVVHFF